MTYIPHTDEDREAMLHTIGVTSLDDLFQDLPDQHCHPQINLPPAMSEMEVVAELQRLAASNKTTSELITFLGAGAYNHYIPSAVDSILRRGEFFTAYTPYQPEVSQGTLQAVFEYQSLVAALTGMDVANASHYDGATAVAEAVNMAYNIYRGRRKTVVVSQSVHPQYRATMRAYSPSTEISFLGDEADQDLHAGPETLVRYLDSDTALVVVQYPDFFGRIFDYTELAEAVHAVGGLLCVAVNPIALGLIKPPGDYGADIVTGEGQPLGIPLSFGGPYLGLFATRQEYVRKIAGRLVGETLDVHGQRGYVLTLTPREQHIRREKATSNICTNQGLMTLAATVYLSLLGKNGLRKVAGLCYDKAHYAADRLTETDGLRVWSDEPFFNEFVIRCSRPVPEISQALLAKNILGGYDLGRDYPALENHMLIAITEMNTREHIDQLVETLAEVCHA